MHQIFVRRLAWLINDAQNGRFSEGTTLKINFLNNHIVYKIDIVIFGISDEFRI